MEHKGVQTPEEDAGYLLSHTVHNVERIVIEVPGRYAVRDKRGVKSTVELREGSRLVITK
jgi:hypothetical protein